MTFIDKIKPFPLLFTLSLGLCLFIYLFTRLEGGDALTTTDLFSRLAFAIATVFLSAVKLEATGLALAMDPRRFSDHYFAHGMVIGWQYAIIVILVLWPSIADDQGAAVKILIWLVAGLCFGIFMVELSMRKPQRMIDSLAGRYDTQTPMTTGKRARIFYVFVPLSGLAVIGGLLVFRAGTGWNASDLLWALVFLGYIVFTPFNFRHKATENTLLGIGVFALMIGLFYGDDDNRILGLLNF